MLLEYKYILIKSTLLLSSKYLWLWGLGRNAVVIVYDSIFGIGWKQNSGIIQEEEEEREKEKEKEEKVEAFSMMGSVVRLFRRLSPSRTADISLSCDCMHTDIPNHTH